MFDQLVGEAEYVNVESKSCVAKCSVTDWATAFSNNILRKGKHYVAFQALQSLTGMLYARIGVMRPGQANQDARHGTPVANEFYQNFSRRLGQGECNNNVQCCMYNASTGNCLSSDWGGGRPAFDNWEGMESIKSGGEIGMLLDLDAGDRVQEWAEAGSDEEGISRSILLGGGIIV